MNVLPAATASLSNSGAGTVPPLFVGYNVFLSKQGALKQPSLKTFAHKAGRDCLLTFFSRCEKTYNRCVNIPHCGILRRRVVYL